MRIASAAAVILALSAVACSDSISPESLAGTYQLISVDGELPFVIDDDGTTVTSVTAGTLTLTAAGTMTASLTVTATTSSGTTTEMEGSSGVYTVDGNTITFTFAGEAPDTGTVSGNTVTVMSQGYTLVFRK